MFHADFWAFCAGTALVGVFQAFAQYYRLAAADAVEPAAKSRAISVVMAGGVIAAIAGPALAAWSRDLFAPVAFAGAYLMVALLALLSAALLWVGYRDAEAPAAAGETQAGLPARPLREVARQPVFVAALANNVVGSVSMMFIMTAAPLACSHGIGDGANIMQWHLVGMYAPAFAGALIQRFGLPRVLGAGMVLNVACSLIAMTSPSLPAFYAALFCLGWDGTSCSSAAPRCWRSPTVRRNAPARKARPRCCVMPLPRWPPWRPDRRWTPSGGKR